MPNGLDPVCVFSSGSQGMNIFWDMQILWIFVLVGPPLHWTIFFFFWGGGGVISIVNIVLESV